MAPRPLLVLVLLTTACAGPDGARGASDSPLPRALRPIPPDLAAAEAAWRAAPEDHDALIWYARRKGYAGDFEGAVALYTQGLAHTPDQPELLRHRGHRYLSLGRYQEARDDLLRAARLVEGQPDQVELDGAPNPYGIPRGTLHTNIWYHLGLACHLLERDEEAARAFAQCLAVAGNDDFRVAAAYWRVLALFHLDRQDEARALALAYTGRPLELLESGDYALLLELLAGTSTRALGALEAAATPLASATLAYGTAMWLRYQDRDEEARARLASLIAFEPSSAFGRLAAEVELARMGVSR